MAGKVISLPASTNKPAASAGEPPAAANRPATPTGEAKPGRLDGSGADLFFRIAGTLVGLLLGMATALAEAVLTPTYIGSVRSPLAPILALVGNAGLVWFTWTVTRRAGLALLPGAAWFVVMVIASTKTSEGDLIITGTWVGLLTLLLGSVGWAGAGYLAVLRRPIPARPDRVGVLPANAGPSAGRSGGGPKASGGGPKAGSGGPKSRSGKSGKAGNAGPTNPAKTTSSRRTGN
jgi:hypothetical protein